MYWGESKDAAYVCCCCVWLFIWMALWAQHWCKIYRFSRTIADVIYLYGIVLYYCNNIVCDWCRHWRRDSDEEGAEAKVRALCTTARLNVEWQWKGVTCHPIWLESYCFGLGETLRFVLNWNVCLSRWTEHLLRLFYRWHKILKKPRIKFWLFFFNLGVMSSAPCWMSWFHYFVLCIVNLHRQ